jgi:hypothetical protein
VSACVVWRGTQFDVNRPHETCCRRLEGKDGANETVKCGNMEVCTGSLMAGCRAGQGRGGPVSQPARAFRSASLDPSQQAAVWGDVASLWCRCGSSSMLWRWAAPAVPVGPRWLAVTDHMPCRAAVPPWPCLLLVAPSLRRRKIDYHTARALRAPRTHLQDARRWMGTATCVRRLCVFVGGGWVVLECDWHDPSMRVSPFVCWVGAS